MGDRMIQRGTGLVALLAAALLATSAFGQGASYTLNDEFDAGDMVSLEHDTVADQLQLEKGSSVEQPFIYIANHRYGTVSKVDTNTGKEVARYPSCLNGVGNAGNVCPDRAGYNSYGGSVDPHAYCNWSNTGHCPSRTAVDSDSNIWVANRAFGHRASVTKIAGNLGNCIDRNGNGVIDTSIDLNSNGRIDLTENHYIPFSSSTGEWRGQSDECVLFTVHVGLGWNELARGLTIDADDNVWVGMYNTRYLYKLSGVDGAQLGKFYVNANIYGLATDSLGYVYNSELSYGRIKQVLVNDTVVNGVLKPAGTVIRTVDLPWSTYGITAERDTQVVWLANWQNRGAVIKVDFKTGHHTVYRNPMWANTNYYWSGGNTRGVALQDVFDDDGNKIKTLVWVSNWNYSKLACLNADTGIWEANYSVDAGPIGVGIDDMGRIWTANQTSNRATRIDPQTGAKLSSVVLGVQPYSYSDMTGVQLLTNVIKKGTFTVLHDSGVAGLEWGTLFWNEGEGVCPDDNCTPDGTEIEVKFRASDTYPVASAWETVNNGETLSGIFGQFVEVQVTLRITGGGDISPVLKDLRIEPANQAPECLAGGAIAINCTGGQVTVGLDGSGSSDPDGDALTFEWSAGTCGELAPVFGDATGAATGVSFEAAGICGLSCEFQLAVNDGKATTTCGQALTIVDLAPELSDIADGAAECNNGTGGVDAGDAQLAGFFGVTAFDACTGSALPVSNNAPAVFGLGSTGVTFQATDICDNDVTGYASMTVGDTAGPAATYCPADDTLVLDELTCTAAASYEAAALDACVGALGASHAYSFDFPGADSYLYSFADGNGNDGQCAAAQIVTAVDINAPVVIDCPADETLVLDALNCTASAGYTATGEDACYGALFADYFYSFSAVETQGFEYVLTDGSGNASSCGQTVNAIDVTAPVLECPADATLEVDGQCYASAGYTATAADNCDGALSDSYTFEFTYWGTQAHEYGVEDASGNSSSCTQTVTALDKIAPELFCNAPETITPPDAPIAFTATATDNCDELTAEITGFDCYKFKKDGSKQSKLESCVVNIAGDTLTIADSGGVDDNIEWYVTVTDKAGNTTQATCKTLVINPGKGGDNAGANQGVGNGPEDADPGNSDQGDPANSNDENGGTPGNPGKKGGKK